jgi:hypothetical protein
MALVPPAQDCHLRSLSDRFDPAVLFHQPSAAQVRACQARKEMEAETAAAAVRHRHEEAEAAKAKAPAAHESDEPAAERAELNMKAEAAAATARAARDQAIETDEIAGVEPLDLDHD